MNGGNMLKKFLSQREFWILVCEKKGHRKNYKKMAWQKMILMGMK
jgi:hypothetical protein